MEHIGKHTAWQYVAFNPDPTAAEFAGGSRRWVRRRTKVRQAPTNKENPVKSAAPKGQKNEEKNMDTHRQGDTFPPAILG